MAVNNRDKNIEQTEQEAKKIEAKYLKYAEEYLYSRITNAEFELAVKGYAKVVSGDRNFEMGIKRNSNDPLYASYFETANGERKVEGSVNYADDSLEGNIVRQGEHNLSIRGKNIGISVAQKSDGSLEAGISSGIYDGNVSLENGFVKEVSGGVGGEISTKRTIKGKEFEISAGVKAEASFSQPERALEDLTYYFRFMEENGVKRQEAIKLLDKNRSAGSYGGKIDDIAKSVVRSCIQQATQGTRASVAVYGNSAKELYENAVAKGINGHIKIEIPNETRISNAFGGYGWQYFDKIAYGASNLVASGLSIFGWKTPKEIVEQYGEAQAYNNANLNVMAKLDKEALDRLNNTQPKNKEPVQEVATKVASNEVEENSMKL
ncbi:hypothetical protein OFO01_07075 [Campylobacter sp. JMF_01 NE2]|uniref:hypothetical protein n=1 Tax=unclassified Campylobacter TaxID=2593542 RepID=UPI0022E9F4E0|nr:MULTISPECIES: hypothetical protein [unclassified Campylobacter]MDA3053275.1 hypothetical protein [Campylobacter sp. JMF_03 NE3]MDA3067542.1 hypothetical protein [Campylobacter sp. JMF_01 NE2]